MLSEPALGAHAGGPDPRGGDGPRAGAARGQVSEICWHDSFRIFSFEALKDVVSTRFPSLSPFSRMVFGGPYIRGLPFPTPTSQARRCSTPQVPAVQRSQLAGQSAMWPPKMCLTNLLFLKEIHLYGEVFLTVEIGLLLIFFPLVLKLFD